VDVVSCLDRRVHVVDKVHIPGVVCDSRRDCVTMIRVHPGCHLDFLLVCSNFVLWLLLLLVFACSEVD
jgi:hypothetical protein